MELIQGLSLFNEEFNILNEFHLEFSRHFEDGYGVSKDDFYEILEAYPALYQELVHMASSAVINVRERRLFKILKGQGIMRAHDELKRSFYKALNELRRHQTWRHARIELGQGI